MHHRHSFNVGLRSEAQVASLVAKEVASEMEGDRSGAFQFELGLKCVDDGLGILGCFGKIIDIRGYILVVISTVSHPDVRLGLGWEESIVR